MGAGTSARRRRTGAAESSHECKEDSDDQDDAGEGRGGARDAIAIATRSPPRPQRLRGEGLGEPLSNQILCHECRQLFRVSVSSRHLRCPRCGSEFCERYDVSSMLHALASGGGSSSTLAMPAGGGGARERHALATGSSPAGSMNMEELLFNMAFFADAQQSGNIGSLLRSTLEESANAESLESSGRDAVSGHLSPASVEVVEMLKERQTMYSGPSAARSVLKDTPSSPRTGEKLARREATSEEDEKATESMKEGELDCDDECPVCADEFQAGHIPGAINIPRGLLEFRLSNDPVLSSRDQKLVLYCKNSGRSALAASALQEMGYLEVLSILGGFDAWAAASKPVAGAALPPFE